MKILMDTHVIIWALTDDRRLSSQARGLILSPENIILVSTASFWELSIKNQKAPEKCPYHAKAVFDYCVQAGFAALPIQPAHVFELSSLQVKEGQYLSNMDPFDRIIIAQAKAEDALLLSHDSNLTHYDENCILLF